MQNHVPIKYPNYIKQLHCESTASKNSCLLTIPNVKCYLYTLVKYMGLQNAELQDFILFWTKYQVKLANEILLPQYL